MLTKFREPVNGFMHLVAAVVAGLGVVALIFSGSHNFLKEISLAIYGTTLVLLFASSASYHLVQAKTRTIENLRKLDHAAIYLLIAGTYTPFCLLMFTGFWRWDFLAIVWSLALIGIVVKMFILEAPRRISAGIYILMGWLSIGAIGEMLRVLPAGTIFWLITGGIIYTLGAIVYITKAFDIIPGKFGFHEIWHVFVILGALAHFIAISIFIIPYGS